VTTPTIKHTNFDSLVRWAWHLNALLVDLAPAAQTLLKGCFERRDYAVGEYVLRFGEKTQDLHVIASGRADVLMQVLLWAKWDF
jgi:CRP-like cAMP-binding protein